MKEIDIQQIVEIVREAGALMDRTGGFEVHDKGARENLVTTSDLAVQHFLTERLGALLPGSGFLCEEEDFADIYKKQLSIYHKKFKHALFLILYVFTLSNRIPGHPFTL